MRSRKIAAIAEEKKQINHHRAIRYFRNSLGVVSHAFGGHWQKSTDFTCNVNGLYVTITDQSINMISSFEAANDFGDWKNHHQINVIATSIQNPCFCEIESCKMLTQTQLRPHLAPLLIPSDGKIHSQLPFQLLDAIIPSIHSISPQCLVVIKVWNKANPLLDAFVPFQSSLPKAHSICLYLFLKRSNKKT